MVLYGIALGIVLVDQATKLVVSRTIRLGTTIPIIPNFVDLSHVLNPGAAFGFLAGQSAAFRNPFFVGISLLAIGLIVYYYHRYLRHTRLPGVALGLILGGAAGNLIDRLRLGVVVDFLDVHLYRYHWPAFNLADAAISVGVGLMLLDMVLDWRRRRARKGAASRLA